MKILHPTEKPLVRVALYARKSSIGNSDKQIFTSVDAQLSIGHDLVKRHAAEGWAVVAEYGDLGVSGATLDRPDFRLLLRDARAQKFDMVVAYRLDRISRTVRDYLNLQAELQDLGIGIRLASQHLDTETNEGRLHTNMELSIAQYVREVNSTRVREKIAASAEKGLYLGSVPPFGYSMNKGVLQAKEPEAAIVREIFDRAAAGEQAAAIAADFNERQLPSPKNRNPHVHELLWSCKKVLRIVEHPVYAGFIVYHKEVKKGAHEGLVGTQLWMYANHTNAIPMRIGGKKREGAPPRRTLGPATYPLLDVLYCPHCGARLRGHYTYSGNSMCRSYVCPNHSKDHVQPCGLARIPAPALEELVQEHLSKLAKNPRLVQRLRQAMPEFSAQEVKRVLEAPTTSARPLSGEQLHALFLLVFRRIEFDKKEGNLKIEQYVF